MKINTNDGEFTGRTVESIIRREYGRNAFLRTTSDPNDDPHVGQIVRRSALRDPRVFDVLAKLKSIIDDAGVPHYNWVEQGWPADEKSGGWDRQDWEHLEAVQADVQAEIDRRAEEWHTQQRAAGYSWS